MFDFNSVLFFLEQSAKEEQDSPIDYCEISFGEEEDFDDKVNLTEDPLKFVPDYFESDFGMALDDRDHEENSVGNQFKEEEVIVKVKQDVFEDDLIMETDRHAYEENDIGIQIKEEEKVIAEVGQDVFEDDLSTVEIDPENSEEEPIDDVNLEPIEADLPVGRCMDGEITSDDGFNANHDIANANHATLPTKVRSSKKSVRRSDGFHDKNPSCAKIFKRFKCHQCEFTSGYKSTFEIHMRKHTGVKPFQCDYCSKYFASAQSLRYHMSTHKDVFPFRCTGCVRGFSQQREKDEHEKRCSNRRYECYICKQMTTNIKSRLKMHMLTHIGRKPYRCNDCSKSGEKLYRIRAIRNNKKKKQSIYCIACLLKFLKKRQQRDHAKECRRRQYECYICKTFATTSKTDLKQHMRRHTEKKPFRCEICMQRFTRKFSLRTHLNMIHMPSK